MHFFLLGGWGIELLLLLNVRAAERNGGISAVLLVSCNRPVTLQNKSISVPGDFVVRRLPPSLRKYFVPKRSAETLLRSSSSTYLPGYLFLSSPYYLAPEADFSARSPSEHPANSDSRMKGTEKADCTSLLYLLPQLERAGPIYVYIYYPSVQNKFMFRKCSAWL